MLQRLSLRHPHHHHHHRSPSTLLRRGKPSTIPASSSRSSRKLASSSSTSFSTLTSYINGQHLRVGVEGARIFTNLEPGTGEELCKVQEARGKDVDKAVAVAVEAQREWAKWNAVDRGRILRKAADRLREMNDELALLEARDVGKPLNETLCVDIQTGADALEYYAGVAPTIRGAYLNNMNTGTSKSKAFAYTRREPLGVCGLIGAWNYPLQIACWKSAPALAAGNSIVFKPSELAPMSATRLVQIYEDVGLPKGVMNVVQGGSLIGQALTTHPGVAKISFTGSIHTGRKVMRSSSDGLKKVTLELGGKSPLILFEDCDLQKAIKGAMMANFCSQGEVCTNAARVFVHQSILSEFLEGLLPQVRRLKVGSPLDKQTRIGALISEHHMKKVLAYIQDGVKEGAALLCGSSVRYLPTPSSKEEGGGGGFYVRPTVLLCPHDEMRVVKEEIFGPVMCVLPFKTEEEVIKRANATETGLGAGLFTTSLQRAHHLADCLQSGMIWINNYNICPVEAPFGGFKCSGMGKENGLEGLDSYLQTKTVYVEMDDVQSFF